MALDPPPWATEAEVDEYGAMFLAACFKNRAHFEHSRATGSMSLPASDRRKALNASDSIRAQRERLLQAVRNARKRIVDAEEKVAAAQAHLDSGEWLFRHQAEADRNAQTARLAERQAALPRAQTDLAIFEALHNETNSP
jgi:hypothetical protein